MADEAYDVVVIGAGPAGEVAAGRCAGGGLSTAIVERELVGGECSYWGCMPSKALLRPGEALAAARRVPGAREAVRGGVDRAAALARRDRAVEGWDDAGHLPWLRDRGVDLVRGHARLAGERVVEVQGADGPSRRLVARVAVVLAAGTAPAIPPVDGLREAAPWGNREATAARTPPRRLLVVGGGAIGCELAQAWRRLGSEEVTVVEAADRLLPQEEPFAGEDVRAGLEADGVRVLTGTRLRRVTRGPHAEVRAEAEGAELAPADEVLVAVGRRPATGDLGLDRVGLEPGGHVRVGDDLRAEGVPGGWLYAVGDVNGRALLTHMGKYQARVAADVILGRPGAAWADHHAVPRVTFTDPQVAAVGLTAAAAEDRGMRVRVADHPTGGVAGATLYGEDQAGTARLVVDAGSGVPVGFTITGHEVAELLHAATVAVAGGVPLDRLVHAVPAFPTRSEVWLRLAEALE